MRYIITRLLDRVGLHRAACKVRGFHVGLRHFGRCLKCGHSVLPEQVRERVINRQVLRRVESIAERNARIRAQVKAYGL